MLSLSIVLALIIDRYCGEPARGHPLVAFGTMTRKVEQYLSAHTLAEPAGEGSNQSGWRSRFYGALGWTLLVMPPAFLLFGLQAQVGQAVSYVIGLVVLYFCIGWRSLAQHAQAIAGPLQAGDLPDARNQLARIVSRDTQQLDTEAVASGTLESVLENGSDAVIAPIFWFVIAGAPGALAYRLANTLDAMWGYRNARYENFGWAAARADDLLNWIPARCCAIAYALVGRTASAMHCWRRQAPLLESPNAGPVMASGAGALEVCIGGPAWYGGERRERPVLGLGRPAGWEDIARALRLLGRAVALLLLLVVVIEMIL